MDRQTDKKTDGQKSVVLEAPSEVKNHTVEVRRELYAQCFDELIRQTTITCVERGLLLLRIRDEARMTLHAYMVNTIF